MGKSYFLNDPSGLEQILLRDVVEHTGNTAVEKTITPKVLKQAEILEGVGMESAPAAPTGYVRFTPRPTADTILQADRDDPLFIRWQYGLGPHGGVHLRRQESLGRELGHLARIRPLLGERLPRPAAARARKARPPRISTGRLTNWWWITGCRAM